MKPTYDPREQERRISQSEKDKGFKKLQQQIADLRAELDELRQLLKEYLVEEVDYAQER